MSRDENGDLVITPAAIPDDAAAYAEWARGTASYLLDVAVCAEGGIVSGPVLCRVDQAVQILQSMDPVNFYLRYVSYDGTSFTLHTSTLSEDVSAC